MFGRSFPGNIVIKAASENTVLFIIKELKKGAPGVIDCIKCKRGVKGKTPLCSDCGGHRFRELARYHKRKKNIILTVEDYINKEKQLKE